MTTRQENSIIRLTLLLFLVFLGYNVGNIIATLFADNLLLLGAGFFSCTGNFFSIVIVLGGFFYGKAVKLLCEKPCWY